MDCCLFTTTPVFPFPCLRRLPQTHVAMLFVDSLLRLTAIGFIVGVPVRQTFHQFYVTSQQLRPVESYCLI